VWERNSKYNSCAPEIHSYLKHSVFNLPLKLHNRDGLSMVEYLLLKEDTKAEVRSLCFLECRLIWLAASAPFGSGRTA
jgi:hypothetical protein